MLPISLRSPTPDMTPEATASSCDLTTIELTFAKTVSMSELYLCGIALLLLMKTFTVIAFRSYIASADLTKYITV